jgi:hypothetical protein
MKVSLRREIRPFYRRWRGWRRILWWLWPVRWAVVSEGVGWKSWDYYSSLGDAVDGYCLRTAEETD